MKTSNKILLGLLIIIFATPFLLATTLRYQVKAGKYTVKTRDLNMQVVDDKAHKGTFTDYKVVKVTAPGPSFLTCRIKESSDMSYKYVGLFDRDSVSVVSANDTLYIKYLSVKNEKGQRFGNGLAVSINLPQLRNLVVDGADVVLDSLPSASSGFSLNLKHNGIIREESNLNMPMYYPESNGSPKQPQPQAPPSTKRPGKMKPDLVKNDEPAVRHQDMHYMMTFHFM